MQWSKLRSQMLDFLAPELCDRIDFHLTAYRKLGDLAQEFLITADGAKIFSAAYSRHNIATYIAMRTTGMPSYGDGQDPHLVEKLLSKKEIHAPADITSSIRTYFDLDPQISLRSNEPILRALAVVDRRIGRRTLKELKISEEEHSLVRRLYNLRMENAQVKSLNSDPANSGSR